MAVPNTSKQQSECNLKYFQNISLREETETHIDRWF